MIIYDAVEINWVVFRTAVVDQAPSYQSYFYVFHLSKKRFNKNFIFQFHLSFGTNTFMLDTVRYVAIERRSMFGALLAVKNKIWKEFFFK